jgi:anaerobic ribonucleoside-triphosphate reductase
LLGGNIMKTEIEEKRTKCEVYSRVVGYMRPISQWNLGKQQEFKDRKTFKIDEERKG